MTKIEQRASEEGIWVPVGSNSSIEYFIAQKKPKASIRKMDRHSRGYEAIDENYRENRNFTK